MGSFFLRPDKELVSILQERLPDLKEHHKEEIDCLEKTFGPLDYLVPFYVTPAAQNVNPADFSEDNTGLVARNSVLGLLGLFLVGDPRFSHALVLSDAGMGKSSLLLILRLLSLAGLTEGSMEMQLFKLGESTLEDIQNLSAPNRTVLLLDALDEDPEAWLNFYTRLQLVLTETRNFRKVVITCRTQFFPSEYEQDGKVPGLITLHGFHCSKLFISPFNDEQVDTYLAKRFEDQDSRDRASKIVSRMRSLKFRPMLLSYIDFLLDGDASYDTVYLLYEALVDEWLNRELRKGMIPDKDVLCEVCKCLAMHLYRSRKPELTWAEVKDLALSVEGARLLGHMNIEGRSLLHMTSRKTYKFAHYSILEYFVSRLLIQQPEPVQNTDQVKSFIIDLLSTKAEREIRDLDLRGALAEGIDLSGARFLRCEMDSSRLSSANLQGALFEGVSLANANISYACLDGARIKRCQLFGANLSRASLVGAKLFDLELDGVVLEGASLVNADIRRVSFDRVLAQGLGFPDLDLKKVSWIGANLSLCIGNESDFAGGEMKDALFRDSKLAGASFAECRLFGTAFNRAILREADFRGAIVDRTSFHGADLTSARFDQVSGEEADFQDALLTEGTFSLSKLTQANLDAARLHRTTVRNSSFDQGTFVKADFSEGMILDTEFSQCKMAGARFENATIRGCTFDRPKIKGGSFAGAQISDSRFVLAELADSRFPEAVLEGVILDRADLTNAIFSNSKLGGVSFEGALLGGATLGSASIRDCSFDLALFDDDTHWPKGFDPTEYGALGPGASLPGRDLSGLNLSSAVLRDSNLSRARLIGVRLTSAILKGANLVSVNLSKADLSRAALDGADLSGANLSDADLADATVEGCVFQGARYSRRTKLPRTVSPERWGMKAV